MKHIEKQKLCIHLTNFRFKRKKKQKGLNKVETAGPFQHSLETCTYDCTLININQHLYL